MYWHKKVTFTVGILMIHCWPTVNRLSFIIKERYRSLIALFLVWWISQDWDMNSWLRSWFKITTEHSANLRRISEKSWKYHCTYPLWYCLLFKITQNFSESCKMLYRGTIKHDLFLSRLFFLSTVFCKNLFCTSYNYCMEKQHSREYLSVSNS